MAKIHKAVLAVDAEYKRLGTCTIVMKDKTRFLVADDDELNLDIIKEYLTYMSPNYQIETAADGQMAWQMLKDNKEDYYDIVLLDNMMPNMTGIDVLKKLQADKQLSHIPVVIQSARARKQDVIEGIEAGAFYYLTKPYNEEQFSNVIRNCSRNFHIYHKLQTVLQGNASSMRLLEEATFKFRTLDDVHAIAMLVTSACPASDRSMAGLFELMVNAVEHGNLGIGYDTKSRLNKSGQWADEVERRQSLECNQDKYAQINFLRKKDHIEITISDRGKGFDWQSYMDFSIKRILDDHGRGIAIANNISFDHLEYNDAGTEVHATLNTAS